MTLGKYVGHERATGLWQLAGLVYLFTIFPIVLTVGIVGGAVMMVIDVISRIFLDRDARGNLLSRTGSRLYSWPFAQLDWIVYGDGDFQFLP
ncbi:MAG: hypothetical protein V5A16_05595 [Haloplanus sp.]